MGGYSQGTKLSDWILAPRAGNMAVQAVTTTVATLDLRTVGPQTAKNDSGPKTAGALGRYVSFQADGGDVYIAFGATAGALASLATATNAVNGASGCWKIPNGTTFQCIPEPGTDIFVGYLTATGTAQLRIAISSIDP